MTLGAESDAVQAFIRERQTEVLASAIADIQRAPLTELRAVLHTADGTVGSYQLDAAHEAIATVRAVAADPASSDEDIESARQTAVATLAGLAQDLAGDRAQEQG